MKFRFLALLALVLGLASCQKDTYGLDVDANGEAAVTISVALPDVETRAGGNDSAIGAFGNVKFSDYDVRYILEVYNLEGELEGELAKERIVNTEDEAKETSFTLRLIPGRGYRFVVWADLVKEGTKTDLHYVTTDLKDIQFTNLLWKLSDETRDAYTGIWDEGTFSSASNIRIELKRPLGKLRVVTTDIKDMFNVLPEEVTVEYTSSLYTKFNAFTSQVVSNSTAYATKTKTIKISENKYANEWNTEGKVKENLTLFADYYFAANEQEPISFTLDVKDNNGMAIPQVVFSTPIPIQRNYLTTVMGPVLTDANSITVVVKDAFDGYINVGGNVVTTDAELRAALNQDVENISIVLGADLSLDVNSSRTYNIGGPKTKTITISGIDVETRATEPYTLTFNLTDSDWSNVITDATLVLKDLNIKTSGYNTDHWKRTHLNFNCDVELYNVTSTPIELGGNSVVKNLTINNAYTDTYALWIGTRGQIINIDRLVVNSAEDDNRGIKIADEDREKKSVTLNIKNAEFNTAKKAAILVTTNYGATINVGENVDITNVAADSNFAVWVDDARAGTFDDIVVNGALKKVEGSDDAVANNDANVDAAIKNGATTVYLTDGTFIIPDSAKGKTITFIGTGNPEDTIIAAQDDGGAEGDCDYSLDGATVTFENVTITTTSTYFPGYARCKGTYKNCIINGVFTLYDNSSFEKCTFNVSGDIYNVWTWGAAEATFTNCTFNCDGKAMLLYGTANTKLTMNNCVFNDNGDDTVTGKAAIETGNDYNKSYELIVNNAEVNGFAINPNGINTNTTLWANKNSMPADKLKVTVDGYTWVADGLVKKDKEYVVSNANGLTTLNTMMANKTAGKNIVVNLNADINFAGKTWTPVDSHADQAFSLQELNGNGHTISNFTINGQAMFKRFAGSGDVTVKDVTFDNASVNSTAINTSILTVQTYQNVLLDNVDVRNSSINGGYKVAPLIGTVYNESSSTITATLKNCDVENVTVKATSYDFCTTGMVAFVYADDNDTIEFENCTVKDVTLMAPNDNYKAHAAIYTTGSDSLYNEAEGVTVTNVTFEAL